MLFGFLLAVPFTQRFSTISDLQSNVYYGTFLAATGASVFLIAASVYLLTLTPTVPFWSGDFQRAALAAPVLADVTSVMDLGIVLGACLAAGLAGRFAPTRRVLPRLAAVSLLGGLLLGYGSRIAFGCNIGAYVSGIASTSLHGWLWGAAALLGTPVGVRLRRLVGIGDRPE